MKLLIVVAALCLGHYVAKPKFMTDFSWVEYGFMQLQELMSNVTQSSTVLMLAFVLPIVFILSIVGCLFDQLLWGIVGLFFDCFVLWFAFGPSTAQMLNKLKQSTDAEKEKLVEHHLDGHEAEKPLEQKLSKAILWQAHESTFAVIFWFMLLGPLAALTYRLLTVMPKQPLDNAGKASLSKVHGLSAWLPARVTALSYIVGGNFVPGFVAWKKHLTDTESKPCLINCGMLALHLDSEHANTEAEAEAVAELTERALYAWIFAIALLTVGGFLA